MDCNYLIRQATEEDTSAIAAFNIRMAMETEAMVLDSKVITDGVRGMIEHPERGFYLVVEVNDQMNRVLIVASLMITSEWSDWRNEMFWWIQSVYVMPEWRRKGLYQQLYLEVKKLASTAANICGFRLYVERENKVAQKTYQALGMQCTDYLMFEELFTKREL